jgi:hypothetical protein
MTSAYTILRSRARLMHDDRQQEVVVLHKGDFMEVKSQVEAFQLLLKLLRGYNPDMPMGAGMKAQFQALLEEIQC